MLGGKSALAAICEISPSMVTRWCKRGRIDPSYNVKIKRAIGAKADAMENLDEEQQEEWVRQAVACLDEIEVCPHCGQPMTGRRVL